MKIALSAIYDFQSKEIKTGGTSHAAVKCCVVVVSMQTRLLQQIQKTHKCVFYRTAVSSSDEMLIERMKKRVEANDAVAMYNLGTYYHKG